MSCQAESIRAHSIQNATHLGLLERDGHIVQMTRRIAPSGPEVAFNEVGWNKASTFTGLCSEHDREIFAPIEVQAIDVDDPWHCFLLAYRAVLHETHATAEVGAKAQAAYLARIEDGRDPPNTMSPAGVFATQRLMIAWETYVLKEEFDVAYSAKDPSILEHDILRLAVSEPSIAASSLFLLDGLEKDRETVRVTVTI